MGTMARALSRPAIQSAVKNTHDGIRKTMTAELAKFGLKPGQASLLDYLPFAVSRTIKATPKQFQDIKTLLLNPATPHFGSFHVYKMPEKGMNEARHRFVQAVITAGKIHLLMKIKPTANEVIDLATYAQSPTTLLAIKYFWLTEGYEEDDFDAYPAMTEPVRDFTKFLMGNDYRDVVKAHAFTKQLAAEVNLNQLNVNTALWVLGNRM